MPHPNLRTTVTYHWTRLVFHPTSLSTYLVISTTSISLLHLTTMILEPLRPNLLDQIGSRRRWNANPPRDHTKDILFAWPILLLNIRRETSRILPRYHSSKIWRGWTGNGMTSPHNGTIPPISAFSVIASRLFIGRKSINTREHDSGLE
jgi:hypothetical protein